jgi:hypothetical protein
MLLGPSGVEPIWKGERSLHDTHREPGFLEKASLFVTFSGFHDLPAVKPFVEHPLFERAVHLQTIDHGDFGYYRANPDRVRVLNKVVDAISLAETEVRANAFRASFEEKAGFYQEGLTREFVGIHGMVVNSIDAGGNSAPDLDGALWTGVYTVTQALRYQTTGDPEALDNLRRSLTGLLMLMDITGDPRTFARTLRLAGPPLTDSWQRGAGQFAAFDWRAGGNNDMSRGLLLGMIAGWQVLPDNDPLRNKLKGNALDLLQLCEFVEPGPDECKDDDSIVNLPRTNPGAAKLLAGITNNDAALVNQGLSWLHQTELLQYADAGAGPFYTFGVSDWSGNHLTLTATIALQWLLQRTQDSGLQQRWRKASASAWEILRGLEYPLHAAVALTANSIDDAGRQAEARDQVLWGLRSFPFPKHPYPVDHRLRADFVISPFPARPWKGDWLTNPRSPQSITAYPMLEQAVDAYRWNDAHFEIDFIGLGDRRVPGVDYLFLYWIARAGGLIGAGD